MIPHKLPNVAPGCVARGPHTLPGCAARGPHTLPTCHPHSTKVTTKNSTCTELTVGLFMMPVLPLPALLVLPPCSPPSLQSSLPPSVTDQTVRPECHCHQSGQSPAIRPNCEDRAATGHPYFTERVTSGGDEGKGLIDIHFLMAASF